MKKVFALFLFFLLLLSVSSAENVSSVRILCTDYRITIIALFKIMLPQGMTLISEMAA